MPVVEDQEGSTALLGKCLPLVIHRQLLWRNISLLVYCGSVASSACPIVRLLILASHRYSHTLPTVTIGKAQRIISPVCV